MPAERLLGGWEQTFFGAPSRSARDIADLCLAGSLSRTALQTKAGAFRGCLVMVAAYSLRRGWWMGDDR